MSGSKEFSTTWVGWPNSAARRSSAVRDVWRLEPLRIPGKRVTPLAAELGAAA
ncbi:hypothetical protein [Frankia tisae]|uniref:hypothetical protein n=1 Tax=Frankia tisae TaxID=2950104 RepID=UPI0021C20AA9|nr:hypothetical protein [Frankia tisae]